MKKALLVGINYTQSFLHVSHLQGAKNDALKLAQTLSTLDYDTTLLIDTDATVKNIIDNIPKHDVLFFSGHGTKIQTKHLEQSAIIANDGLITLPSLWHYNKNLRASIDACFAGQITPRFLKWCNDDTFGKIRTSPTLCDYITNHYDADITNVIFANCLTDFAYEFIFNGVKYGAHSYYLDKILNNGCRKWKDILKEFQKYMPATAYHQYPCVYADNLDDNFI